MGFQFVEKILQTNEVLMATNTSRSTLENINSSKTIKQKPLWVQLTQCSAIFTSRGQGLGQRVTVSPSLQKEPERIMDLSPLDAERLSK